jgi:hypothetical protein
VASYEEGGELMAEAPTFSGFSSGDSAQTFAKVIAQIKADMASIEASAKNIEGSLSKASRANISGGAGSTGTSKPAFGSSSLGKISTQLGGASGIGHTAAFGAGAAMGGMGIGGTQGWVAGGLAFAGLPDLALRPERALDIENARFGVAQATGDFGSFRSMMDTARNSFNVQDQQAFRNTVVWGTQRAGMVGLNGGGTVGERRAASQIGGFNTMAALAGIDQSQVPGAMNSMLGAPAYYASMAAGVMTRNPVTGETIGVEGQTNQLYKTSGLSGMSQAKALQQIDISYGIGGAGRAQLMEQYGGDEAAVDMVIEGLRVQARQGGKPLTENQVQDQMKDIGEEGGLGTEYTQGNEGVRALENAKTGLDLETLNAATAGIEEATKHITNAVEYLTDLEGALATIRDAYVTMANQMDVFKTELPGATKGITDFLSGLPGLLAAYLMGGGGGRGGLLRTGGRLLGRAAMGLLGTGAMAAAAPVIGAGAVLGGTVVATGLIGKWAVDKYTDYDERSATTNNSISRNAGTQGSPGTSYNTSPTPSSSAGRAQSYTPGNTYGSGYGRAKGDWFVEADQDDRIHYGEMVLPNRIANAVREELAVGKTGGRRATSKGGGATVNIYLTIQRATDQEAMQFAGRVRRIIENDNELLAIGSGRFSSG